ncbi:hypothetical protein HALLA_05155 [Halostagnicola larsenii XH-48]|uniref:Uncharacterized protein n=1 Tax=Halostagnicola larsenii XH-48 TaxID=797299 RepID=W0JUI0_9EURY|nr:hypothetical protein HALLA_05155 [Halostagnicola larsenii XH-48]
MDRLCLELVVDFVHVGRSILGNFLESGCIPELVT